MAHNLFTLLCTKWGTWKQCKLSTREGHRSPQTAPSLFQATNVCQQSRRGRVPAYANGSTVTLDYFCPTIRRVRLFYPNLFFSSDVHSPAHSYRSHSGVCCHDCVLYYRMRAQWAPVCASLPMFLYTLYGHRKKTQLVFSKRVGVSFHLSQSLPLLSISVAEAALPIYRPHLHTQTGIAPFANTHTFFPLTTTQE